MVFYFGFLSLLAVFFMMSLVYSGVNMLLLSFYGGVSFPLEFSVMLDFYGLSFGLVVCVISLSVMLFSEFYMAEEVFKKRFCYLIILFVASMFILLVSGGMGGLMVGWDGLGLVSFLLVIYYESKSSLSAGMLTVMTNRIGDVLFIVGMGLMSSNMFFNFPDLVELGMGLVMCLVIFLGSITKSAQIPFSAWLPAAMAAPTPVSTLVHSSTLVTAGLFVIIRFSSGMSGLVLFVLLVLSGVTCVMAGGCALIEPDLKKVVALSTLSQLGVMGVALSLGDCDLAFFHLMVHALFKALMFMCVGCYILSGFGVQECRSFSGLYFKFPVVSSWLVVSCLSLSGFPYMAGFFSKDLVLEGLFDGGAGFVVVGWVSLSCVLTSYYSFRLAGLILMGEGSSSESSSVEEREEVVCSSLLGVLSVVGGVLLQSLFLECSFHCEVSLANKLTIISSLLVGVGGFILGSKWDQASGMWVYSPLVKLSSFFFGSMFFMRGFSGSALSSGVFNMGLSASELESGYDHYLGESGIKDKMLLGAGWSGMSLHFGVWMFLFYYLLLVLLFSGVFNLL